MVGIERVPGPSPMQILIVDDHALIREALRGVLAELVPDAALSEAGSASGALRRLEGDAPVDLVVLDLGLPDRDGLDVLAGLRERWPTLAVVVLSASEDRRVMARALELGALGFVPKSASREVMRCAFALVLAGGVYVPPETLAPRAPAPPAFPSASPPASPPGEPRGAADRLGLTERQGAVLALMRRGMSNKAICRRLDIAEATVKNHVTAILRALGASNRTEAVVAAAALDAERD